MSAVPPPTSPQEIVAILRAAIASGGGMVSYSANGRTVTLSTLGEMTDALRFFEAQVAQGQGLRRTRVGWRE